MTKQKHKKPPVKKSKISTRSRFLVLLAILLGLTLFTFKQFMQKSDINMIAEPVVVAKCGLIDLNLTNICGANMFQRISGICADNTDIILDDKTSCKSVEAWYKEASVLCANKCTAVASKAPEETAIPTIVPSVSPSPFIKPSSSPLPSGCYLQKVQCIKAPCADLVVCSSPNPSARQMIRKDVIYGTEPVPTN